MLLRLRRGCTQDGARITQDNALDFRLAGHAQVGLATLAEALPGVIAGCGDGQQTCIHLTIDLCHHGRQQALFVAEMVVERATGKPGASGQVIHGRLCVTLFAEDLAGHCQQGGAGFFHLGAGAANHGLSFTYNSYEYLHSARMNI